jgi:hypothetical protein
MENPLKKLLGVESLIHYKCQDCLYPAYLEPKRQVLPKERQTWLTVDSSAFQRLMAIDC